MVLAIIVDAYGGVRDGLLAEQSLQRQPSPLAESGTGHAGGNDDGAAGDDGLTGTGTPCKLHSGGHGGGGSSQLQQQHQHQPPPVEQSAVKQVLAMGEKEGWKTRLMGVGGGEKEIR